MDVSLLHDAGEITTDTPLKFNPEVLKIMISKFGISFFGSLFRFHVIF